MVRDGRVTDYSRVCDARMRDSPPVASARACVHIHAALRRQNGSSSGWEGARPLCGPPGLARGWCTVSPCLTQTVPAVGGALECPRAPRRAAAGACGVPASARRGSACFPLRALLDLVRRGPCGRGAGGKRAEKDHPRGACAARRRARHGGASTQRVRFRVIRPNFGPAYALRACAAAAAETASCVLAQPARDDGSIACTSQSHGGWVALLRAKGTARATQVVPPPVCAASPRAPPSPRLSARHLSAPARAASARPRRAARAAPRAMAAAAASSGAMPAVVSGEWLQQRLGRDDFKVLDCSWHMPNAGRDAAAEFAAARLPGARFFDLDGIKDAASPLPHMLPPAAAFGAACGALGVRATDDVVLYDCAGLFSAARGWWMFRVFGHAGRVAVLEGGLPLWRREGRPLEEGPPGVAAAAGGAAALAAQQSDNATPAGGYALDGRLLLAADDVARDVVAGRRVTLLDARPAGRFTGAVPEPRPGLRGGHIPGSRTLPFATLLTQEGRLLPPAQLAAAFAAAGADVADGGRRMGASCGTGVTACVIALAAAALGRDDVAVYDGSWTEWGSRQDTPVETGDA